MATPRAVAALQNRSLTRLEESRERTDGLFDLLLPASFYERPIPERHRLIFYLGHLEAFDWNLLAPKLGLNSDDEGLDKLFAFGIDPVDGGLPKDVPSDWPSIGHVKRYKNHVRSRLDKQLIFATTGPAKDEEVAIATLLNVAIEHRLMHAETLAYLFHNLPPEKKVAHPAEPRDSRPAPQPRLVEIPGGIATLGRQRENSGFGWDNEFGMEQIDVPSFSIEAFPVTNQEYLKFMRAGGYDNASHWKPEDWEWRQRERIEHPHFWQRRAQALASDSRDDWDYRGMFGAIPLPASWPVFVSHAEARAFARWAGKKLPTEGQWQRAAYGTPEGKERMYPWGDAPPDTKHGNFHHARWEPTAVTDHPAGASAFGVHDLLGNGWEWTSTPFGPLQGFEPFSFYKGYSANFFDGKHFVMKGGSQRTDACMLRRTYRNWFQPHYPYVYATFRCVAD